MYGVASNKLHKALISWSNIHLKRFRVTLIEFNFLWQLISDYLIKFQHLLHFSLEHSLGVCYSVIGPPPQLSFSISFPPIILVVQAFLVPNFCFFVHIYYFTCTYRFIFNTLSVDECLLFYKKEDTLFDNLIFDFYFLMELMVVLLTQMSWKFALPNVI